MIDSVIDNPIDVGGVSAILASVSMQILSAFNIADINPYITGATGIAGFVFVIYKILHIRIKKKLDREELKRQKMENKMLSDLLERRNANRKDNETGEPTE